MLVPGRRSVRGVNEFACGRAQIVHTLEAAPLRSGGWRLQGLSQPGLGMSPPLRIKSARNFCQQADLGGNWALFGPPAGRIPAPGPRTEKLAAAMGQWWRFFRQKVAMAPYAGKCRRNGCGGDDGPGSAAHHFATARIPHPFLPTSRGAQARPLRDPGEGHRAAAPAGCPRGAEWRLHWRLQFRHRLGGYRSRRCGLMAAAVGSIVSTRHWSPRRRRHVDMTDLVP